MATVRATWTDLNSGPQQEDEIRVYRSNSPFNESNLPAVMATLPADSTLYDDTTAVGGETYTYGIAMVRGSTIALSTAEITVPGSVSSIDFVNYTSSSWRVRFLSSFTQPFVAMGQIQLKESSGGANVALEPANGASSSNQNNVGYESSQLFDGDPAGNGWFGNYGANGSWVQFDFLAARNIQEITIVTPPAPATLGAPKTFVIEAFDSANSVWVAIGYYELSTAMTHSESQTFAVPNPAPYLVMSGEFND